jgi:hypothetical protein
MSNGQSCSRATTSRNETLFAPATSDGQLNQGDLIASIDLPEWRLNDTGSQSLHVGDRPQRLVVHGALDQMVIVCSHDCDIDQVKGGYRAGVIVAPLGPPPRLTAEMQELLRDSWRLTAEGTFEFGHLYPVKLPGADDSGLLVADFSRMISAGPGKAVVGMLLDRRTCSMDDDEQRRGFQLKLAAFFGRGADERPIEEVAVGETSDKS